MISPEALIGRHLMMYNMPSTNYPIVKVTESNTVYRISLDIGIEVTLSEKSVQSLLDGNRVQGWVLLGIGET